jgi:predicted nucleotidyltransferase
MERGKKIKLSLDAIFFVTPEQRLIRFLISESTTSFTPRVLSSKLKGVRGLGGSDGIKKILEELNESGLIHFVDNNQKICLNNDHTAIRVLKSFAAICDLETLIPQLEPISTKGVLFGSRATGLASSESDYNIFIVSNEKEESERIVAQHPIGKRLTPMVMTQAQYIQMQEKDIELADKISRGYVLWGSSW